MISSNVIKGVHELLEERGIRPEPDETFGDVVGRALHISSHQSERLLEGLHSGESVEVAASAAGIDASSVDRDLLIRLARAIGTALGRAKLEL